MNFFPQKALYGDNRYFLTQEELAEAMELAKQVYEQELTAYGIAGAFSDCAYTGCDITANLDLNNHPHSPEHLNEAMKLLRLMESSRFQKQIYGTGTFCFGTAPIP